MHVQWFWIPLGAPAILALYQQLALYHVQTKSKNNEELFKIVTENAADMIALVDVKGRRLYNSPAYKRILGYTAAELGETSAFEQIHPEDRFRVLDAAWEARETGAGKRLEYRIKHKDGSWRVLELVASTIRDASGKVAKLVIVNRDEILQEIARRIGAFLRQTDTVARIEGQAAPGEEPLLSRLGGDEFTILLDTVKDPSDDLRIAKRIQQAVAEPLFADSRELRPSVGIGIVLSTPAHVQPEDMLRDADVAMRRAKALGESRCEVFDEAMHTRAAGRLRLESDLRTAIASGNFGFITSRSSSSQPVILWGLRPCCTGNIRRRDWSRPTCSSRRRRTVEFWSQSATG